MRVVKADQLGEAFKGKIYNRIQNELPRINDPFGVRIIKFIDSDITEDDYASKVYMRNKLNRMKEVLTEGLGEEIVSKYIDYGVTEIDIKSLSIFINIVNNNSPINSKYNLSKENIIFHMREEIYSKLKESCNNNLIKDIYCIIQQPIPKRLSEILSTYNIDSVDEFIYPEFDIDCTTPQNFGRFILNPLNKDLFMPCTVRGIYEYISYFAELRGLSVKNYGNNKTAVIIGRSNIVGKPALHLLSSLGFTVVQCHSKTTRYNLIHQCNNADLIITAVGQSKFLTSGFIDLYKFINKDGGSLDIIDVGINRDENGKLCGDVDKDVYESVNDDIFVTPVPGGLGILTTIGFVNNLVHLLIERNK